MNSRDRIAPLAAEPPAVRSDLQAVLDARAAVLDENRPDAVARLRKRGRWTVREAIAALADPDTFLEYGALAAPADQRMQGAADGLVMGTAQVDGRPVDVVAYDFSVYSGTQSAVNHQKITRMFEHAESLRLPVVCWLEGGGARPHDMLRMAERGSALTFVVFARLSGLVPTVGIVPSRAFAGHANLAGMCDFLVALRDAAIGMAGPPLVEAALGQRLKPEEIGPAAMHAQTGVVDALADDEAHAIALAQKYLGYFAPRSGGGTAPDTRVLRDLVPENPRRAYDVRRVIEHIVDVDSMLELKAGYGRSLVTTLARLDGRTVGVLASQPMHMAGAIDSAASIKGARFVQLSDAFDIPLLVLCDTPGLMVGPAAESTGLVRHSARLLVALANATVPMMTVVLRKAYGLGRYIMGSRPLSPAVLLAWPTTEYGGMGMEGAVSMLYGDELAAIDDPQARSARAKELADDLRSENTALKSGKRFNYDDIIDPADTRRLLLLTLATLPAPPPLTGRKRTIEPF